MARSPLDRSTERRDVSKLLGKYASVLTKHCIYEEEAMQPVQAKVRELAHVLAEQCHSADMPGLLMRLNTLLHAAHDSVLYDASLGGAVAETPAAAREVTMKYQLWLRLPDKATHKEYAAMTYADKANYTRSDDVDVDDPAWSATKRPFSGQQYKEAQA